MKPRNRQKEWYERIKKTGICINCRTKKARAKGVRCEACHELHKQYYKEQRKRLMAQVLDHYGNCCACCGEIEPMFLTIDHINGGGNIHRRQIGKASVVLHRWLIKNDFPKGFQVLCFNCNIGRSINFGICPHKNQ